MYEQLSRSKHHHNFETISRAAGRWPTTKNTNETGWWYTYLPLWKIWKSVGMMTFPIYGKIKNDPNHQPGDYWVLQVLLMKRPQPRRMTNRFWSCADQTDWDAPSSIFGVSCPEKNNPYGTTVRSYCVVAQHSEYESPNLEENAIWLECILWYCVHWFDFPCSRLSFWKNVYSKYLSTTLHGITFQKSMVNLCYGSPQKNCHL